MGRNGGPYTKKRFMAGEATKRHPQGWSARVVVRYALLQVPALSVLILMLILVQRWVDLHWWLFWCLVALWVAKDIILFPFTWRAYHWDLLHNANPIVGSQGRPEDRLAPSGYIRVRGELWQAEMMEDGPPIEKGQAVRVRGIRGLTLLVQPNSE